MKKILFVLSCAAFILLSTQSSKAQDEVKRHKSETSTNYFKSKLKPRFGIYALGGVTIPYTDVVLDKRFGYSFGVQGLYKATYFLDVLFNINAGKMGAESYKMEFENNVITSSLVAHLAPFKFIKEIPHKSPLYYLSTFYVGAGVGMVKSKTTATIFSDPDFDYVGNYQGFNVMLPLDVGFNLPLFEMENNKDISLLFNYQFGFVMGDKIDGYITPKWQNNNNDVINTINIGLGYNF